MKKIYGVMYALISAIAFGFMPIFAKGAYNGGANAITAVFLRFFFAAIILYVILKIKKVNLKIEKELIMKIFLVAIAGYASTALTLFLSYKYISVGLATTLHFIYPAVVTFLSFIIYKEKLNINKIASLIFSLAGVYILIGFCEVKLNIKGILLALGSGVVYSIYIVEVGHSKLKEMDCYVLTLYMCLFGAIGILAFGIPTGNIDFHMSISSVIYLILISLVCTIVAFSCFVKAIQRIGGTSTSILSTFEPITSVVLGVLLFGEPFTITILLGGISILISVIVLLLPNKNEKELQDEKQESCKIEETEKCKEIKDNNSVKFNNKIEENNIKYEKSKEQTIEIKENAEIIE